MLRQNEIKNNTQIQKLTLMGYRAVFFTLFILFFSCLAWGNNEDIPPEEAGDNQEKELITAKKHIIVSPHPLATEAGLAMLRKGGNAIDAAIASQMVVNVVEPQSSGIGGGGFLLYYDAITKTQYSFNGREVAPKSISETIFLDENGQPRDFYEVLPTGESVGVPGLLKMLFEVHKLYGVLPWSDLFESAIELARDGFPLGYRIHLIASYTPYLHNSPGSSIWLDENGTPKPIGTIITNPQLAETFETIAYQGIESFYSGEIANTIVNEVDKNNGHLTLDDLKSYKVIKGSLLCNSYHKYKICTMPPPSSGITMLQTLKILENFDLYDISPFSAESIDLIGQASRIAFADRSMYLADPLFVNVPSKQMLSSLYIKQRVLDIVAKNPPTSVQAGQFNNITLIPDNSIESNSTIHISVVDSKGNAIALTSTIEHGFGSTLMAQGFILNNQLTDFAFQVSHNGALIANRVQGGKRPRSSMVPVFIYYPNGELFAVLGSPGGSRIINYVTKTIIALLDWDMDIQQAIDAPHILHRGERIELEEETAVTQHAAQLREWGHNVKIGKHASGIHGIIIENGILKGAADPRRDGTALGD